MKHCNQRGLAACSVSSYAVSKLPSLLFTKNISYYCMSFLNHKRLYLWVEKILYAVVWDHESGHEIEFWEAHFFITLLFILFLLLLIFLGHTPIPVSNQLLSCKYPSMVIVQTNLKILIFFLNILDLRAMLDHAKISKCKME